MGLFRSHPKAAPAPPPPSGYSLLDAQVVLAGDLETAGSIRVDGRITGNITQADAVVVGVGASTCGDIHAREVLVSGTVTGSVYARERVELQPTAVVNGDVTTPVIVIAEGGVVNGRVVMAPPVTADAAASGKGTRR